MEYEIVKELFITLLLGFLIGMQRSIRNIQKKEPVFMGGRTFALIALCGFLAGWMNESFKGAVYVFAISIAVLLSISYYMKVKILKDLGITTYITAFLTFLLGLMVWLKLENYAIFIGVIIIILLEIKPRLRKIEQKIDPKDVNSVILLLVMTFVILPVLPNKTIDPYNLFNPYKTWLMAVLIAAISFVGYIAIKFLGHRYGVFLTGAAGGLISSTAVSVSLSKMFQNKTQLLNNYAGGIAIACTFMYIRVLFEAFVINPSLSYRLAIPYIAAFLSGMAFVYFMYKNSSFAKIDIKDSAISKNPLQLSEALKFGLIFGIIYGAVSFVEDRYGDTGVYLVSFFSGLTDVDAITLSLSELAKHDKLDDFTAISGIVTASVTNSLVKLFIVYWVGGKKLGFRMTQFFVLTLGFMGFGLFVSKFV